MKKKTEEAHRTTQKLGNSSKKDKSRECEDNEDEQTQKQKPCEVILREIEAPPEEWYSETVTEDKLTAA